MDVYMYRDVTERIKAAEEKFPGNGPTVALLEAIVEQNEMIGDLTERMKSIKRELDHIWIAVGDIVDV